MPLPRIAVKDQSHAHHILNTKCTSPSVHVIVKQHEQKCVNWSLGKPSQGVVAEVRSKNSMRKQHLGDPNRAAPATVVCKPIAELSFGSLDQE